MEKGEINNNLKIFNDKYLKMFNDIKTNKKEKDRIVDIVNDILFAPKELMDFCQEELKKSPVDSNVLILGGGYGGEANRVKLQYKDYNLYTLDISEWGEKIGKEIIKNVNFITGDMCYLDFKDDFFDIIFSTHSLEHTPDIDKTMSEVYRVIKNNGVFGLGYPYKWQTDEQHVYMFQDDLIEYMSAFGEVEDTESKEHQSRMLKVIIKKDETL